MSRSRHRHRHRHRDRDYEDRSSRSHTKNNKLNENSITSIIRYLMGFIPRPSISLSTLFKYGVAGTAVLLFCTASACICLALLRIVSPNEVDNFISASSTTIMNNVTDFSGLPISIQRKIITLAEYMEADPQTMKRVLSTLPQEVQQVSKYHIPSSLFSGFPLSGLSMIKPILSVLLPTSIVLGVGNYILTNFTEGATPNRPNVPTNSQPTTHRTPAATNSRGPNVPTINRPNVSTTNRPNVSPHGTPTATNSRRPTKSTYKSPSGNVYLDLLNATGAFKNSGTKSSNRNVNNKRN